jgi:hypothetical protein
MKSAPNWDTAVTLAFAAEQSFAAAALLTSNVITQQEALRLSYDKYISPLLEHTRFLPLSITARLRSAQAKYLHAEKRGIGREDASRLASELMVILRRILPLLERRNHGIAI